MRLDGVQRAVLSESVLLGCGPDSARAYPYTVGTNGGNGAMKVNATDHPLTLAFGRRFARSGRAGHIWCMDKL